MPTTDVGLLIADGWHMNGWWMGGMMIWMVVFWGALIAGVVWFARGGPGQRSPRDQEALAILANRFAEGAISLEEYQQRKAALKEK